MDKIDILIARILEANPTCSLRQISKALNLTITPVWKRLQKLEQSGFITRKVVVDWERIAKRTDPEETQQET